MTEKTASPVTAADRFVRRLAQHGVPYLFGNAGTDSPPLIEALAKAALEGAATPRPVTVPHENLAVAMAHGAYLATGQPQAVMLHVNVGTANALCGLFNAAREAVPIVLTAGRTPILEDDVFGGRSVFIHWGQEMFDQAAMLREMVRWDYELRAPSQAEAAVDRALALATGTPGGPVYLTLPREVIAAEAPDGATPPPPRRAASAPAPDPAAVAEAAGWIAEAENPVIVTASYGRDADDVPALAAFAERHALPVIGYRPRYMFLPGDHPMHMGYEHGDFLDVADLVIVLDCDVPWIPKLHRVNPEARVVHIGADPLFARYPMRSFRADIAIAARSAATLRALDAALAETVATNGGRVAARRRRLAARRQERDGAAPPRPPAGGISPAWLAHCLGAAKADDDIVVMETTLPLHLLRFREPGTYFGVSPAGGLGWGLGAALGLKLGRPERRVIAAVGDGSYMFGNPTPAHFVAAALDLPVLTVVANNRMWGAVRRATLAMYPDGAASKMNAAAFTNLEPSPDYEKVIAASGGYGEKVEDPGELPAAFDRALAVVTEEKRSALLNVITAYPDADAAKDARR